MGARLDQDAEGEAVTYDTALELAWVQARRAARWTIPVHKGGHWLDRVPGAWWP